MCPAVIASSQRSRRMVSAARRIPVWAWPAPGIFVVVAIGLTLDRGGWPQMWATAFGVYFACKCWVVLAAVRDGVRFSGSGIAAFVMAWAGMDPRPFSIREGTTDGDDCVQMISLREGLGNMMLGGVLLLVSPMVAARAGAYAAMWLCVSAYCLLLHFGLLHVIGFGWQRAGRPVEAIMQRPARSTSLADFWSRRWNRAFRDLSNALIVRPTRRYLGPAGAVGLVFLVSGIVHELVMSWPARGGWGLPTMNFLMQCAGLYVERSPLGRRWGLMGAGRSHGVPAVWRSRIWTAAVVIAPLPLLVNRVFAENVVIPFYRTLGAV